MEQSSIDALIDTLLNDSNDAWRDDAAEALEDWPDARRAESALMSAIESPKLNDSLRRTCAESLAGIWIRERRAPEDLLSKLTGMPRVVVEAFLRAEHVLPENDSPEKEQ